MPAVSDEPPEEWLSENSRPVKSAHAVRDKLFICMDIAHIGDGYLGCESCSVQSSL